METRRSGRRWARFVLLFAMALVSPGCLVVSLAPFYDDRSIEFDPALIGTWQRVGEGATIMVERGAWNAYRVEYRDRTREVQFTAWRMTIGDDAFVDVAPPTGVEQRPLVVPVHAIARLTLDEDRLTLEPLDYDWFLNASARHALVPLEHALDGKGEVVLTSPTSSLRAWLTARLDSDELFGEEIAFERKKQER